MKKIFKDQPSQEVVKNCADFLGWHIANWNSLNGWLKTEPTVHELKIAALLEGRGKKRAPIINRLLVKIFKIERANAEKELL